MTFPAMPIKAVTRLRIAAAIVNFLLRRCSGVSFVGTPFLFFAIESFSFLPFGLLRTVLSPNYIIPSMGTYVKINLWLYVIF